CSWHDGCVSPEWLDRAKHLIRRNDDENQNQLESRVRGLGRLTQRHWHSDRGVAQSAAVRASNNPPGCQPPFQEPSTHFIPTGSVVPCLSSCSLLCCWRVGVPGSRSHFFARSGQSVSSLQ